MKHILTALILTTSMNVFAQDNPTVESTHQDLRNRTHGLTWDLTSSKTEAKNKDTSAKSETSSARMNVGYLYNFGRFELGASYSSLREKNETSGDESTSGALSLIGQINIIENKPGNDVIPYIAATIGSMIMESNDVEFNGGLAGLGFGLKWFPVSEIFALTTELGAGSATIEGGTPKVELELRQSYFNVGWAFYF